MNTPNDNIPVTTDPYEATPNAGQATDAEAALIAAGTAVDGEGNLIDASATAAAAAEAEAAAKAAEEAAAAKAAEDVATAAAATAEAARIAAQPIPAAPVQTLVLPQKPVAPQDFAAARAALKQQYENGDDGMDQDAYLDAREKLVLEEAAFKGQLSAWESTTAALQTNAQAAADAAFNAVALDWEKRNADFIANPLRQEAMQKMVDAIDKETGYKLAPNELFAQAEKVAFEAFNYTPKTVTSPEPTLTAEQIAANALANRRPDLKNIPATLQAVPQAAGLDPNNATYTALDKMDISNLEDTLARMTPDQAAKYLADAPGATSTGHENE